MFEIVLAFIFLPTILWVATGPGKAKINNFAISTLEEIVDSLPEKENKKP